MGEPVETYLDDDGWKNRIGSDPPLPGTHRTREAAVEVAQDEARVRGVLHVIREPDGSVADRRRYARRSDELLH
jgi:hypothetical protein